jgi:hypothetical protein
MVVRTESALSCRESAKIERTRLARLTVAFFIQDFFSVHLSPGVVY